jgi:hypothetical protein
MRGAGISIAAMAVAGLLILQTRGLIRQVNRTHRLLAYSTGIASCAAII